MADPNKTYDPKAPENRFPRVVYHDTHTPEAPVTKTVSKDEHEDIGSEWHDEPLKVPTTPRVDAATLANENAALKAQIEELKAAQLEDKASKKSKS